MIFAVLALAQSLALALPPAVAVSGAAPGAPLPAATELRRIAAPEARQGAAGGHGSVYAVGDHEVARYDAASARRVAHWSGDPVIYPHLNSCELDGSELVCAASNYPQVPMDSQVLWFDAANLKPLRSHALGHGHGSLTWFVRHEGSWWACYANYDGKGGEPGRDHRATTLVRMNDRFEETGLWTFPETVLSRMAPRSSSGGSWGKDGLLYVTGHDLPEIYAVRVPRQGGVLEHVATIAMPTGGQAIGWAPDEPRVIWSIERKTLEMVASRVPPVKSGRKP
ncbi:hypothetical protein [Novosphingobium sp. ST904]|uniref:hypothetical protein n=1 Tax=Novosphingobium sp. ST904 TaxID=1684385 RepID=UPI0006C84BE8|nr:hypothetical protein [Novosphingobium sp. ST904]KPH58868.1 hypothetical protein ADT71_24740 [Novosphingobium sp. ST904]TCM37085.1 hypothetical protein EDF59_11253 [Novosphingobium sp. ST904]